MVIVTTEHETNELSLCAVSVRFYPEKIKQQKVSIRFIVESLKGKAKEVIIQKFTEYTGIDSLLEEEIQAILKSDKFSSK